jgi:hypothetical protein
MKSGVLRDDLGIFSFVEVGINQPQLRRPSAQEARTTLH